MCPAKILLILSRFTDDHERLTFLTSLADRVNKPSSQDAFVYATVDVASVKLRLMDYDGARKDLDKAETVLEAFDSVETVVHASFYRVNANYYQVCKDISRWGGKRLTGIRQNSSLHLTTKMLSSTSRVSTSKI